MQLSYYQTPPLTPSSFPHLGLGIDLEFWLHGSCKHMCSTFFNQTIQGEADLNFELLLRKTYLVSLCV